MQRKSRFSNDGKREYHGMRHTAEYRIWSGIIKRCSLGTRSSGWRRYAGRGIKVCARWRRFSNFYADMGPRPSSVHSIERNNVHGNYEPGNCRWATPLEQARNTTRNRFITAFGRTQTASAWAEETGLRAGCILSRMDDYGWTPEQTVSTPMYQKRRLENVLPARQLAKLVRLYKSGKTLNAVAKIIGCARGSVESVLLRKGILLRDDSSPNCRIWLHGRCQCLTAWCREFGISPDAARRQFKKLGGWEQAFYVVKHNAKMQKAHRATIGGVTKTYREWGAPVGMTPAMIRQRMQRDGLSLEEAISKPAMPQCEREGQGPPPQLWWIDGVEKTLVEWAEHLGLRVKQLEHRIARAKKRGKPISSVFVSGKQPRCDKGGGRIPEILRLASDGLRPGEISRRLNMAVGHVRKVLRQAEREGK